MVSLKQPLHCGEFQQRPRDDLPCWIVLDIRIHSNEGKQHDVFVHWFVRVVLVGRQWYPNVEDRSLLFILIFSFLGPCQHKRLWTHHVEWLKLLLMFMLSTGEVTTMTRR